MAGTGTETLQMILFGELYFIHLDLIVDKLIDVHRRLQTDKLCVFSGFMAIWNCIYLEHTLRLLQYFEHDQKRHRTERMEA